MSARDVIADWIHFEASIQNGFENSRGRSVNDHAEDILSALRSAGFAVVPVEPTEGMKTAACRADDGIGNGVPVWVRLADGGSDVRALVNSYKAMLKAAQEDSK